MLFEGDAQDNPNTRELPPEGQDTQTPHQRQNAASPPRPPLLLCLPIPSPCSHPPFLRIPTSHNSSLSTRKRRTRSATHPGDVVPVHGHATVHVFASLTAGLSCGQGLVGGLLAGFAAHLGFC